MNILSKISALVLFVFLFNFSFAQYGWPFPVSNQQGAVVGSVGEYRNTCPTCSRRFHKGVDLTNGENFNVHAINDGTVSWNYKTSASGSTVTVVSNNVRISYVHIEPIEGIITGSITEVHVGDKIGDMIVEPGWRTHVHLEETNTNFLDHGLNPYVDREPPYFATTTIPEAIRFYRNGLLKTTTNAEASRLNQEVTIEDTTRVILYNKVDIAAHVIDPRVNAGGTDGGGQMVPTIISWKAKTVKNILLHSDELRFDGIPNNSAVDPIFHPLTLPPPDDNTRFIHIITGHPSMQPYDRFWNTGLRADAIENWSVNNRSANLDARVNEEAKFPDGKLTVALQASDVDYDDSPNLSSDVRNEKVIIDNFLPYIKEVTVRNHLPIPSLVYHSVCKFNPATGALQLIGDTFSGAGMSGIVFIEVKTSEPVIGGLGVNMPEIDGNLYNYYSPTPNTNDRQFKIMLNSIGGSPRTIHLNFRAQDLAGNSLQSNPELIGLRLPNGAWQNALGGEDKNHTFNVGFNNCSPSSGGRLAKGKKASEGCLYADISSDYVSAEVNELIKFNAVVAGNGTLTYNWNFGEGATPPTSTSSGEQNVIYTTPGNKTVTLELCDNTGACITASQGVSIGTGLEELMVDFSADRQGAVDNQTIQLTSNVSGAMGEIAYSWDFGGPVSLGHFSDVNPLIAYTTPGNKTVRLTVTDSYGRTATKIRNDFIQVQSSTFNVEVTLSGCGPSSAIGVANFGRFVTGGNGYPYDSYLWDFGDGTTSTSTAASVSHTYKKSGKYTVRLTVCDETSCGTAEMNSCVSVPTNVGAGDLAVDFLIGDLPRLAPPYKVSLNTPVKFTPYTTGGGEPETFTYNWDFESHYNGGTIESATPGQASSLGPIAQEVYYTYLGKKEVSLVVVNATTSRLKTTENALEVVAGLGSGTCYATIGEVTLSSSCWNSANKPKFNIPVASTNCPIAKTEVIYWIEPGQGVVLPNGVLDFASIGVTPEFPLTADFSFAVYQYDGINYNRIGYKRQRFTIYGPVTADAGPDKQVCLGSVLTFGPSQSGSQLYQWSSTSAPLNFISNQSIPNPSFTGVQLGTFNYKLTVTDPHSGCSKSDDVTISVNTPSVNSAFYYARLSVPTSITVGVTGGFGGNSFEWNPPDYLSSSTSASPDFNAPIEGDYVYEVNVKDQQGCSASGQVRIDASSAPANLRVSPKSYTHIMLSWIDRSPNESGFVIQRSINGGVFTDYALAPADATTFSDLNVSLNDTYTYKVAARINNNNTRFTDEISASTGNLEPFSVDNDLSGFFAFLDIDGDLDLDYNKFVNVGPNEIYFNQQSTYTLNQTLGGYSTGSPRNFLVADFDNDNDNDIWAYASYGGAGGGYTVEFLNNNSNFQLINTQRQEWLTTKYNTIDFDLDNDVDLLAHNWYDEIIGTEVSAHISILTNTMQGGYSFSDTMLDIVMPHSIVGGYGIRFDVGDMDNDGDEDMIVPTKSAELNLHLNNSIHPFFSNANKVLLRTNCGLGPLASIDIGDFDMDGKRDILQVGGNQINGGVGSIGSTSILKNNGNNTFTDVSDSSIPEMEVGFARWGDYDADGYLDFFITQNMGVTYIYRNANGMGFELVQTIEGSGSYWIDYDGDGYLDIVQRNVGVIRNNLGTSLQQKNTTPSAPTDLCVYFNNANEVTFSWSPSTDNETPSPGLTYNLFVKQNGQFVMSPLSDLVTGFRRVAKRGNVDHNTTWTLKIPGSGDLEWGVQAIDNSLMGSTFATNVVQLTQGICGTISSSVTVHGRNIQVPECSSVLVNNGATLTLEAANNIYLTPGLTVTAGSFLKGRISNYSPEQSPCVRTNPGGRIAFEDSQDNDENSPIDQEHVVLYPNPTTGLFNVRAEFNETAELVEVSVVNLTGTTIYTRHYSNRLVLDEEVDITSSSEGLYMVKVSRNGKVVYKKIIKL